MVFAKDLDLLEKNELSGLIGRILSTDPNLRPSMEEVSRELQELRMDKNT